jgi:hypothetical protein
MRDIGGRQQCTQRVSLFHELYNKGKVVPVLNCLSSTPWPRIGEWRYRTTVLDLGTRWRWVVSFRHRLLYSQRKSPRHLLDRRLGGIQIRSGRCGEKSLTLWLCQESNSAAQPVAIPTELSPTHFSPTNVFLQSHHICNIILIINGNFYVRDLTSQQWYASHRLKNISLEDRAAAGRRKLPAICTSDAGHTPIVRQWSSIIAPTGSIDTHRVSQADHCVRRAGRLWLSAKLMAAEQWHSCIFPPAVLRKWLTGWTCSTQWCNKTYVLWHTYSKQELWSQRNSSC